MGQADEIQKKAEVRDLILRLMGACAVVKHCPNNGSILEKLDRVLTDIDFAGYSRDVKRIRELFVQLGYPPKTFYGFGQLSSSQRRIYHSAEKGIDVDVFLDKLEMCHTIEFRGRLESDSPTIPLAELVLEKTQIVQINEKDMKDVLVLVLEHDIGDNDKETINAKQISNILSKDWGFYYTVTSNLKKINEFAGKCEKVILDNEQNLISARIGELLQCIEEEPKSMNWKMRAKLGTKKKWYTEVEALTRT